MISKSANSLKIEWGLLESSIQSAFDNVSTDKLVKISNPLLLHTMKFRHKYLGEIFAIQFLQDGNLTAKCNIGTLRPWFYIVR